MPDEPLPRQTWTLVSYAEQRWVGKQTTHPGHLVCSPEEAMEAVLALASRLDCKWVLAASDGPDLQPPPDWDVFNVQESQDGRWHLLHWSLPAGLLYRHRSQAVRYAFGRGTAPHRLVRIFNQDGTLRRVVIGYTPMANH